ncbi:SDR family NAD(P)-dependent oxidoreductase [Flavobacterium sp.]|uniref:SDR family oxidoreductase n=1 Tax=Flavobacterium sp. TaxID=239 RepID=UPI00120A0A13|nr:SDR family NAD(P)-dependent oxidoreductase [Flavobacterium sp.]RZJ70568.1 MAG: SDR family NAD(P)-dependent oxidoreductase [Flavobacterium sp.]
MDLRNNTILITGGTSGFGLEFTKRFLELGNTVIITGRNSQKLLETKDSFPEVHFIQSDVSKLGDIEDLYEKVIRQFPNLNIIINNAGEMRKISLHQPHELSDITREIDINLIGPIRMTQQFLPHLKSRPKAAIVNVTSGIALLPFALSPIYGASKAGLRSYTQSLRIQLEKTNIKVIELVAPGSSTPLNDKFKDVGNFSEKMLMAPEKIVDAALKGLQKDNSEIFPGMAKLMRILSRLAPKFMIAQAGKIGAETIHSSDKNQPK